MKAIFFNFLLISTTKLVIAQSLLNLMDETDCDIERERTFIMIKPDGVQRGLIGEIIQRFERKGFKLVAMKFLQVNKLGNQSRELIIIWLVYKTIVQLSQ